MAAYQYTAAADPLTDFWIGLGPRTRIAVGVAVGIALILLVKTI